MAQNVFSVPVFLVVFREALETVIIVSILLAFLKQTLGGSEDLGAYKKLRKQVLRATHQCPTRAAQYRHEVVLLTLRFPGLAGHGHRLLHLRCRGSRPDRRFLQVRYAGVGGE
jgi:high-affinity Fe2+/Pb2+ permease